MSKPTCPDSFLTAEQCLDTTRQRLPEFPLERIRLVRLIAHMQRSLEQSCNNVLKPYGLNYSGYHALMMLYGSPDFSLTPSALSDATSEKRNNITRICDDLAERGLIAREASASDRRSVVLALTAQGQALVEKIQPEMWAPLSDTFGDFSSAELKQLRSLLYKQLSGMDKHRT
ncbi:MAG: MarR family transcriptional regulator [Pedobacter sp.]|nr:MarR family transcriptional regulator [Pedobacter sp.]